MLQNTSSVNVFMSSNLVDHADLIDYFSAIAALEKVRSTADFIVFAQSELQIILPHGAFICWAGKIGLTAERPLSVLAANVPADYLDIFSNTNNANFVPNGQSWWEIDAPAFFDIKENCLIDDTVWLERFRSSGLKNVVSFGVRDIVPEYVSCFNFYLLPENSREKQIRALKWLIPHLHQTFLKLAHAEAMPQTLKPLCGSTRRLSQREREILEWMRRGKTNAEIASILGIAFKTVKNQVQSVLVKLRVNNRAQAVATALECGVIEFR